MGLLKRRRMDGNQVKNGKDEKLRLVSWSKSCASKCTNRCVDENAIVIDRAVALVMAFYLPWKHDWCWLSPPISTYNEAFQPLLPCLKLWLIVTASLLHVHTKQKHLHMYIYSRHGLLKGKVSGCRRCREDFFVGWKRNKYVEPRGSMEIQVLPCLALASAGLVTPTLLISCSMMNETLPL